MPRYRVLRVDPVRRGLIAVAAMTALVLLAPTALGAGAAVSMVSGNTFSPTSITITVGDTVTWSNADAVVPHTVTANNSSFDSGAVLPGGTYSRTFNATGTFAYHCTFHPPGMVGTVIVKAAATPPGGGTGTATNRATLPATDTETLATRPATGPAWELAGLLALVAAGALAVAVDRRVSMARLRLESAGPPKPERRD